jgi:hypothetical protein
MDGKMDQRAVDQARERLNIAEDAVAQLSASTEYEVTKRAWSQFLLAANAIFMKLQAGAGFTDKSRAWFNDVMNERKGDGLLQYLHQSRHHDEHGLERVLSDGTQTMYVLPDGFQAGFYSTNGDSFQISNLIASGRDGPSKKLENPVVSDITHLIAVTNRGVTYPVPTDHLGKEIFGQLPLGAASAALPYLRELVAVASYFAEEVS